MEIRLEVPRDSFGIAVHGNWVYFSGGQDVNKDEINTAGRINLVTGERTELAPMQHERSLFYLCNGPKWKFFIVGVFGISFLFETGDWTLGNVGSMDVIYHLNII